MATRQKKFNPGFWGTYAISAVVLGTLGFAFHPGNNSHTPVFLAGTFLTGALAIATIIILHLAGIMHRRLYQLLCLQPEGISFLCTLPVVGGLLALLSSVFHPETTYTLYVILPMIFAHMLAFGIAYAVTGGAHKTE